MRPVQFFSDEYLARCSSLSASDVVKFLDEFRRIHAPRPTSEMRLISMKIDVDLLESFKTQAELDGVPYQTRIKKIMRDWLTRNRTND